MPVESVGKRAERKVEKCVDTIGSLCICGDAINRLRSLQLNYLPAMPDYAAINAHNSLIAKREAYWNLNQTAPNSPECLSAKYAYANALMGNDDSTAFRLLMDCDAAYNERGDSEMRHIAFSNAMLTLARIAYRKSDDAFELAKAYGVSL